MMAPSKTFNIAGMMNSVVVISNPELRRPFEKELLCLHLDLGNIFGHVTLEAAYKHGDAWLDEMVRYLEKNILFTDQFLREELPSVKMILPEGSFYSGLISGRQGYPTSKFRKNYSTRRNSA